VATAPAIDARRVRKVYRRGAVEAVAGIDVLIEPGQCVGLLGPNGAGKSTFVTMACGLVRPTAGSLEVCGERAGTRAARQQIGYLAERFRFPDWLTAGEVLTHHQQLAGSSGGAKERAELLDRVGLAAPELAKRRLGAYSKGMMQRLGIAQALVGSPSLVILDEPTSALDPQGRRLVRDLLESLRGEGKAVILNSHLLGEVEKSCERVLIMQRGRIVREGAPSELTESKGVVVETADGEKLFDKLTRDDIPDLIRSLTADGISIYRVEPLRSTLEDAYLEALEDARAEAEGVQ
jgi:ABC-2 type transport system ATP-binding protein